MKAIVSLSGGRDSSTLLAMAVDKFGADNVFALSFEYGSKHPVEIECARKLAEYYGIREFKVVEINPEIFKGSKSTLLKGRAEVKKDKTYDEIISEDGEGAVDTYVPARNFLFSAYIAAYAESKADEYEDDVVYYLGQHADDAAGSAYPDCSPEFTEAIARATEISSSGRVHYEAPFVKLHKDDIIKKAIDLKLPLEYTFSCYDPVQEGNVIRECGRCATCLDVKKAMEKNGIEYKPTVVEL